MSEIRKLIERLCPDGVEYKKLGEVCDFLTGFAFKATTFKKTGLPICKTTNIQNNAIDFDDMDCFDLYDYSCSLDKYIINKNDIVIGMSGSIKVGINKTDRLCYLNQRVGKFSPQDTLHNKFLFYLLCQSISKLSEAISGGSVKNLSNKDVLNFEIPVPPIEVQSKIVEILDNLTELEIKLEAELEARRKQYEYYRNQLLTFDEAEGARFDVKWMTLGEISMYAKERIDGNLLSTENYVGVENLLKDKGGKTSSSSVPSGNAIKFKPGDILIGNIRPYLKKIWLANSIGGTNGDVLCIRVSRNDLVSSDYLYKCLSSDSFFNYDNSHAKGGKMPRGDKKAVMEYSIPLPPLSEQQRIVSILDRFEALTTDLQSGLPAEIEARRKQYEYYREKLLTFKRKTA